MRSQKGLQVNLDETGVTMDQVLSRKPVDALTGKPVTAEEAAHYEKATFEDRMSCPTA